MSPLLPCSDASSPGAQPSRRSARRVRARHQGGRVRLARGNAAQFAGALAVRSAGRQGRALRCARADGCDARRRATPRARADGCRRRHARSRAPDARALARPLARSHLHARTRRRCGALRATPAVATHLLPCVAERARRRVFRRATNAAGQLGCARPRRGDPSLARPGLITASARTPSAKRVHRRLARVRMCSFADCIGGPRAHSATRAHAAIPPPRACWVCPRSGPRVFCLVKKRGLYVGLSTPGRSRSRATRTMRWVHFYGNFPRPAVRQREMARMNEIRLW